MAVPKSRVTNHREKQANVINKAVVVALNWLNVHAVTVFANKM
jgi:hypothetical protein